MKNNPKKLKKVRWFVENFQNWFKRCESNECFW